MSSNLTQQQKKSRKAFSKTMKQQIKRRPHTEPINGVFYTYGILQKISQSSLFNNERFLLIRGHQTFGYASKLPQQTLLPFLQQSALPKCKVQLGLQKLQINNQKQTLVVEFQQENKKQKTKWMFKCGSKAKAIEWRQKIQGAQKQKFLTLQNDSVKVILQDPNQNIEESQAQLKKKIQIMNYNTQQQSKVQQQGKAGLLNVFGQENIDKVSTNSKQQKNQNIMIKQQSGIQQKQRVSSQRKQKYQTKKDENSNPSQRQNAPKFPQFNIFQSLLSASPTKAPLQYSKLNVQSSSGQKYNIANSGLKSSSINNTQQNERQQNLNESSRLKQQFIRRKKEESQLKQQLQEENNNFFSNVLKSVSDSKFQLQKLKKQWGYQFAKGTNEYQVIQSFKIYIQILTIKIVDELALQSRKRFYKPIKQTSQSIRYQIDGISLEFFFNQLNQVSSFQGKGSIVSNIKIKQAYQQIKNNDYVLQLTNNKGRIRVPLIMCVEYKGLTALAKTLIPECQNYQNLQSLQKQLDLLQAQSRIHNSVFQDGQNGRIIPLQSKIYEKIARTQNNYNQNGKKFDICYIQGLKNYLPQDFYRYNQNGKTNHISTNSTNILRKQLIQDQQYEDVIFHGQNMMNVINRLKIPQYLKDSVDVLTEVSKTISDRVNALVLALQNLDQVITNSKDLSNLMHGYGLNIRYLGLLLERTKQSWLKSIIISEIAARCSKYFMKFDLQDCILNLNQTKLQNIRKYQQKQVISFLNKILGSSQQSDLFWNQLNRQAQQYFHCFLDKNLVNIGFFIQSLQQQCRIKLINVFQNRQKFFKVPQPLSVQNFSSFQIKSKTYDLSFTQLYTNVTQQIKQPTQQSYQQLSILLNLSRKGTLPSHFRLNQFEERILLYMINWLPPSQGKQIYYPEQIRFGEILPTKTLYQIKLTQIKWLLKNKQQQQAQKVRDFIIQHINKWLGQYHPILSQLYDLFSRYYLTSKYQQKKSITYCKTSIKNIQKLLTSQHIKLADNYYMLSQIYVNYQKKTEALSSLKRAKQILEQRQGQSTEAYGLICLRMAQLLLANNQLKQALEYAVNSYTKLLESDDLEKFIECIQLIGRCYEVDDLWNQYVRFSQQIIVNTNKLHQLSQNPELLEKALKVIILPHLYELSKNPQSSKQLLSILSMFPSLSNLTPSVQNSSYSYIKSLINYTSQNDKRQRQYQSFPLSFLHILNSQLQQLLEEIQSSGLMTRWKGFQNVIGNKSLMTKINSVNGKGFQFLAMLQALGVFLGEGWIEGVLREG